MKMQKTCYVCLIHTCLNGYLVKVMGQITSQMLMIKWMTSIGESMPMVILSAVNKGIIIWIITAMETQKGWKKLKSWSNQICTKTILIMLKPKSK